MNGQTRYGNISTPPGSVNLQTKHHRAYECAAIDSPLILHMADPAFFMCEPIRNLYENRPGSRGKTPIVISHPSNPARIPRVGVTVIQSGN